ncbi:MAG TPA: cyclase family protein, partial [Candidatus Glassbacteria bacterium]|nr:cyclase family protein [Candidatus Glassbacteria bacterium]
MLKFKRIYDISVALGTQAPVYPGDPEYRRSLVCSMDRGDDTDVSQLSLCAHSGTHIDLPAHFVQRSPTVEVIPPQEFILPARVVEIEDRPAVSVADISGYKLRDFQALLCKTGNSLSGLVTSGRFSKDYVYLSPEAAEYCVEAGLRLVGLDYYSVDGYAVEGYPVHRL